MADKTEEIEWLKVQIAKTKRMLNLVDDHPLMAPGLKHKLKELEEELEELTA